MDLISNENTLKQKSVLLEAYINLFANAHTIKHVRTRAQKQRTN